jgi:hypothetical protein
VPVPAESRHQRENNCSSLPAIQHDTGTERFDVAFWPAFLLHALAAEAYLAARPTATGRAAPARTA